MKKTLFIMLLIIPILTFAQKTQGGKDVIVTQAIDDDLYIGGGTATINAPVHGDLIAGAGTIILNDSVDGDVIAGGGKIIVNGYVGENLRGFAGEITLNGQVERNMVISAGTITTTKQSVIQGNTLLAAGTAVIGGTMNGNFKCRGGNIRFNGAVMKDVDTRGAFLSMNGTVRGQSILAADKIEVGNDAAFYQNVSFWQNNPGLDFKGAIKLGKAVYDPSLEVEKYKWQYMGFASVLVMIWYLAAAFVFILLIQYFFKKTLSRAADEAFRNTARSIGYGLSFFISAPVAVCILMITLVGIPLGVLLLLAYATVLILASVISSVVIANWINKRSNHNWSLGRLSLTALGVFILLKFLAQIPVLGWLMMLIICSLTFGSIVVDVYARRRKMISVR